MNIKYEIAKVLLIAALGTAQAYAADCNKPEKVETEMSEDTYGTIQTAMELAGKSKPAEAIEKLAKIADKGTDYEKATVNYNLGLIHNSKSDYPNAVKSFAKALSTNALPQKQREQLQYNLGQLYVVTGQSEEGIKTLQNYMANACQPISADAHIFLANALSEKKRYAEALPQIDLAISKAKETKELWYQMKLAIAYDQKDYKSCAEALVLLIAKAPEKPDYWKQLSGMFLELKDEPEAVAVMALAEKQGMLQKPAEVKNLYSVYMMMEAPYKAGTLMEDAIAKNRLPADEANLGSLSDAWINARETAKAEATLKKLASMSEKGDYFYKLGGMYGDDERWKESKEMLEKAIAKGGLKRPGDAYMRIAMANYSLKDNIAAIAALQKAITFDETRKQAGEWLHALNAQVAAAP
jgi:tetratricopeptide (TPR) repeat protein